MSVPKPKAASYMAVCGSATQWWKLGEPEDPAGSPTNGVFRFVEDVDAVYAAGARGVRNRVSPSEEHYTADHRTLSVWATVA